MCATRVTCTCCKGSGTQRITFEQTVYDSPCMWCDGQSVMTEAQAAEHRFMTECWCRCNDAHEGSFYHEDDDMTLEWCVRKHHWHCRNCHKLTQIG